MNRLLPTMNLPKSVYYEKNGNKVRETTFPDLAFLAPRLRCSDMEEIWASHHVQPYSAICQSYASSSLCMTALIQGEPFAIFGCTNDGSDDRGMIWFLATDRLKDIQHEFIKYSRHFVDVMLEHRPILYNWVDSRNVRSIAWLKMLGANIGQPLPYGMDLLPFHYFEFRRK